MMSNVITFPSTGWCVRPGVLRAHYLFFNRGRLVSACGTVERIEFYRQQRLRPLQARKLRCQCCERELTRANKSLGDAA